MPQLIRLFTDLALFRRTPQDLPASSGLLAVTALAAFAAFFVTNSVLSGPAKGFPLSLTQVLLFGAVVWTTLALFNRQPRWIQVMSSLYGVSALLHLIALAPVHWIARSGGPGQQGAALPLLLVGAVNFWFLVFSAVVFREALEIRMGMAIFVALACDLSVTLILVRLFGPLA